MTIWKSLPYSAANEVADEIFASIYSKYQLNLETSIRGIDYFFDSVQLIYYEFHRGSFIHDGSYIDSLDRITKTKTTINQKNIDDKYIPYTPTAPLNYEEIESHPERVSNIKPFINKHNRTEINYSSKINDWKTFEKIIWQLLLIFCILKKNKYFQLISQKLIRIVKKKKKILLMIAKELKEGWYYLAIKNCLNY